MKAFAIVQLAFGSLLVLGTCPSLLADDLLEISAVSMDRMTVFEIRNTSGKAILVADPMHAGTVVSYSFPGLPDPAAWTVDADSLVSKHLILLTPWKEDMPYRSIHSFSIRNGSAQPLEKLTIKLWTTTPEELAKDPQAAFKAREYPVKIEKPASGQAKDTGPLAPEIRREADEMRKELQKAKRQEPGADDY